MVESSKCTMKRERPSSVDEPFSKRSKASTTVRGEDDYMPGSIIEIELSNFMTYDSLFCKPAPRLNLVIGPNGSGKSSIVCAIALGLCGEPQLLGRATRIGAYVKRGEDSGYIKITLKGSSTNEKITIKRKIDTRNKSEWLFNGKLVSKKEVSQVIQRFNIQVNNLTQAVKKNGETLHQLRALNAELEKDVKRVRQRAELLAKAELMKKKLPWVEYDRQQAESKKAKILEMDADKKLKEAEQKLKHFSEPIELKEMGERNNKMLFALKDSGTEKILEAYNLVRHHKNELKKHVYGPVLLEVNVSDQIHADYLESRVPYYIWKSFITQDPSDRDFLVKKLKGYDIPVLNCARDENSYGGHFKVSDKMRELGIYSRLDQVFDAPDAIKKVLISQFGLTSSYIGSKESVQRANEVPKLGSSTREIEKLHQSVAELQQEAAAMQKSVDYLEEEKAKLDRQRNLLFEVVSCKGIYAAKQMASIEFDAKVREMEINLKEHEKVAEQAAVHLKAC
ncbi:Structural maintenance of chromosomes protein 5 [Linum grandiflorum]